MVLGTYSPIEILFKKYFFQKNIYSKKKKYIKRKIYYIGVVLMYTQYHPQVGEFFFQGNVKFR